jgi:Na+-driven multidrug efflux pump
MFQFGRLMTQRIFPYFGTSVIAANAVASVINSFSFMTGNAYCMAALTVVGQCIGAGDYDAAKKSAVKILKIAWATIFVFSGSIFLFRNHVIVFFNLSPEAQDTAKVFLSVHSLFSILAWTLSFVLPYALRAAGDAKFIMAVGIVSCWAVRVVGSYFFSFTLGLGPVGVWLAMGMDFISRGICFTLRWKRGKWQKAKVID